MSRLSIRYLAAAALLFSSLAWGHDHGFSISTNFDKGVNSCDQLEVSHPANVARAQQQFTVPANALLKINAAQNGGVAVEGWDKNEYSVTACKLAAGNDEGDAQRTLSQIQVTQSGGQFNFSGPASSDDEKDWMVYVLIHAPRNANMDIETYNGPLFFKSVEGRLKGRAHNGPIALKNSSGNIDIEAQNGPVAVEGSGGTVQARTHNGPLAVSLTGTRWEGGQLNASTVNGPVALRLPNNLCFRRGVGSLEPLAVRV